MSSKLAGAHLKVNMAVRLNHLLQASDTARRISSKVSWQVVDRVVPGLPLLLKSSLVASLVCPVTCKAKRPRV